jgi:hypothetical protein
MKGRLICSSPTLAGVQRMLGVFFCGSQIKITEANGAYTVRNATRELPDVLIERKGGRYLARFRAYEGATI